MRIKLIIEDLEIGQSVTITADGVQYWDEPDPGEEIPEEFKQQNIRAIGKRTGTDD